MQDNTGELRKRIILKATEDVRNEFMDFCAKFEFCYRDMLKRKYALRVKTDKNQPG